MAVLQAMKEIPETFEELAAAVFYSVVPRATLARRVDFVTDRYPDVSIKNPERAKRASQGTVKWSGDNYTDRIGNCHVYCTVESKCFRLYVDDNKVVCEEIHELNSNHEEADTKILLHAKHASENGETTIVIKSPDTDVAVLACHLRNQIPARLLVMKKSKTRDIYLEISDIADSAGPQLCDALPGVHAFTGCDSTSSFAGKGKKVAVKICKNDPVACQGMALLGQSFEMDEVPFSECEKFACKMYGWPDQTDVNNCRYVSFCARQSQSQSLPPCKYALQNHTKRANYQAAVWRRALQANPEVPSPEGHGWLITEGDIKIDWMSLPPAPKALLELILCGCTGICSTGHCTCKRNGLSCTDACQCGDKCENPHNVWEDNGEDSETEED
ncbi:hypothetical protein QZH41_001755 [Actinostola sp. cb2023]|nr:hypothetical protein QZH41_001755 [Actinostola sp. cb2023]